MNFRVQVAEPAKADLAGIVAYVARELCNPTAAERLFEAFASAMRGLALQPERFPRVPVLPWRDRGYHIRPVGNYVIVFHVDSAGHVATIERIFHSLQDWPSELEFLE